MLSPQIIGTLGLVVAIHFLLNPDREWSEEICERPLAIRIFAYSTLTTILVCFGATDAAPFIYFQF